MTSSLRLTTDETWTQAKILVQISDIYAKQGEKKEAIRWFTQARMLSVQVRLDPRDVQRIEHMLDHVRVQTDTPG